MIKAALAFLSLLIALGCAYFFYPHNRHTTYLAKGRYARIPIDFIENNALVEVEIEGKKYSVKLDLGAACQFAFFREALENIAEKKFIESITTMDLKGNQYKVSSYSVPCVKAKNLECKNAVIFEESRDFVTKGAVLWRVNDNTDSQIPFIGRMGRDCFRSTNLFIDFPNSMIFITNSIEELKVDHWPICDLFETSFEMGLWGIILSIDTDRGVRRFVLDTGAKTSILKESSLEVPPTKEVTPGRQIYTTTKFAISGHDFGPFDLSLFEMTPAVDADGLLGLDFLKKYAIYLDFKNKKAFIGPSSKICGAIIFS